MRGRVQVFPSIFNNSCVAIQQPIIKNKDQLAGCCTGFTKPGFAIIYDQRTCKASGHLFRAAVVRVIPIRAGIGCHKIIVKRIAGRHWGLCQRCRAIHGIFNADTMPVHSGWLRQVVDQLESDPLPGP